MRCLASLSTVVVALAVGMACERVPSLDVAETGPAAGSASLVKVGGPKRGAPSASESASAVPEKDPDVFPLTDAQLDNLLNPTAMTEYTGPTGAVEGVIKVKGDPPELRKLFGLPKICEKAVDKHAPTYRKGPDDTLMDALVAVIGYSGYVRPSRADRVVTIKDCSMPRVIDLSLGQRLMVGNEDPMPYTPQTALPSFIHRVAIQGQSPVPVLIAKPGAYGITWLTGALPGAPVPESVAFVLPNALHTVSGPDGKYRITGVPVGSAWVTTTHVGMPEARQQVKITEGKTTRVDLTLTYKKAAPAPSSSSSVSRPMIP